MLTRRSFVKAGLAAAGFSVLGCSRQSDPRMPLVSVARDRSGQYSIRIFSAIEENSFKLDIPARAHDIASRPQSTEVVVFDRRPGQLLYHLDWKKPDVYQTVQSHSGRHFYGHGVFSQDGRWLYTTENRLDDLSGVIGIYDAGNGYQRTGEWELTGHGPHEIALMPDGMTLVVALGGIKTHPDSGRKTLNPDTMQPALLYIDRQTGVELERRTFIDHHLSIRHLDVMPDGLVAVGMQLQGEVTEALPLAALHRRGQPLQAVSATEEQWMSLNGYVASVCCLPEVSTLALTSPRGNKVAFIDLETGMMKTLVHNSDCAGLARLSDSSIAVSNGLGQVQVMRCQKGRAELTGRVSYKGVQWDNHMTLGGLV